MPRTPRPERSLFLLFLAACFIALMTALPMVAAQSQPSEKNEGAPSQNAQAPSAAYGSTSSEQPPNFERADRNKDGAVDKSEAGVVPGLSANFERIDRNKDGRLDKDEFERGLQILEARR